MWSVSAGRPRLLLPLILQFFVTTSPVQSIRFGNLENVNEFCCRKIPVDRPTFLKCSNCKTSVFFPKNEIPSSIADIQVSNANEIIIGSNAIFHLSNLQNITLTAVNNLTIETNGLQISEQISTEVTIQIEHIKTMKLQTRAFSGTCGKGVHITAEFVTRLDVASEAVSITCGRPEAPSLALKHISILMAQPAAFSASELSQLSLQNVSMPACYADTFAGGIRHLRLENVRIGEVAPKCVHSQNGWASLKIHASRLVSVQSSAFCGNISEVSVEHTTITELLPRSFDLFVTRMKISVVLTDFKSYGLAVHATEAVTIRNTRIGWLRESALARVRSSARQLPITLHHLHIDRAEEGSLAFAPSASVNILNITLGSGCQCPTQDWIGRLCNTSVDKQTPLTDQIVTEAQCVAQSGKLVAMGDVDCGAAVVAAAGERLVNTTVAVNSAANSGSGSGSGRGGGTTEPAYPVVGPVLVSALVALLVVILLVIVLLVKLRTARRKLPPVSTAASAGNAPITLASFLEKNNIYETVIDENAHSEHRAVNKLSDSMSLTSEGMSDNDVYAPAFCAEMPMTDAPLYCTSAEHATIIAAENNDEDDPLYDVIQIYYQGTENEIMTENDTYTVPGNSL